MRQIRACEIRVGDKVDLEGDQYADPTGENPVFACEYVEVTHVEQETPTCVAISFEGFDMVGFPTEHMLKVKDPWPECAFCEEDHVEATFAAAQSTDCGRTVSWVFICTSHADGWNDGGDWSAPLLRLVEAAETP